MLPPVTSRHRCPSCIEFRVAGHRGRLIQRHTPGAGPVIRAPASCVEPTIATRARGAFVPGTARPGSRAPHVPFCPAWPEAVGRSGKALGSSPRRACRRGCPRRLSGSPRPGCRDRGRGRSSGPSDFVAPEEAEHGAARPPPGRLAVRGREGSGLRRLPCWALCDLGDLLHSCGDSGASTLKWNNTCVLERISGVNMCENSTKIDT